MWLDHQLFYLEKGASNPANLGGPNYGEEWRFLHLRLGVDEVMEPLGGAQRLSSCHLELHGMHGGNVDCWIRC